MNPTQSSQAGRRFEDALDAGRAQLLHCRERMEAAIRNRPIGSVGSALAVGWLSGKLGLGRVAASAARSALPLAPYLLAVLGAARVWEFVQRAPHRPPGAALRPVVPEPPEQIRPL